jgi:glucokinase
MKPWVIGVDLGGTKIEMGLVDPQDRIVERHRMPTGAGEGPEAVVERLAGGVDRLKGALPAGEQVAALGLCSPGPLDHKSGMLLDPPNLPRLHHTPLRQMLADRLDLPVQLEHDAKAAALGEFYYGAGRGERSMVYIVAGTGVGAAIIAGGELYRGEHNLAGEVGHSTLDRDGELCHCGSRGCAETYLSGPWLARRYERAAQPAAGSGKQITGKRVAQLAREGDPVAQQVMNGAGEALGLMVAAMAMILNIDLYVLGGSVSKSGDLLLGPARRIVPQYSFESVSAHVRIVVAERGEDGPILGCSWLARQALGDGPSPSPQGEREPG